jgi:hypothetical protein
MPIISELHQHYKCKEITKDPALENAIMINLAKYTTSFWDDMWLY